MTPCRVIRAGERGEGGGGGGVSGVTYPGPQGIIGALRSKIVLWLNSGMQFKRIYVLWMYRNSISRGNTPPPPPPPPPPRSHFQGLRGPQTICYPGPYYGSHRPCVSSREPKDQNISGHTVLDKNVCVI